MTVLTVTTPAQTSATQCTQDKQKCKPHNTSDQANEIIGQTRTSKTTKSEPEDQDPDEFNSLVSNLDSSSDSE